MRDQFGVAIEVGDVILSAASREGGYVKLGKVYGFDKQDHPLIKFATKKWQGPGKGYGDAWSKGSAGSTVIVLMKAEDYTVSPALLARIDQDFEADAPSVG